MSFGALLFVIGAALLQPGAPANGQPPRAADCTDWRECRQLVETALETGDVEHAQDLAWRAVQRGPKDDPDLMFLLARAQSRSGRPHDALVMIRRLAERGVHTAADTHPDLERMRALDAWPETEVIVARVNAGEPAAPAPAPAASTAKPRGRTAEPAAPAAGAAARANPGAAADASGAPASRLGRPHRPGCRRERSPAVQRGAFCRGRAGLRRGFPSVRLRRSRRPQASRGRRRPRPRRRSGPGGVRGLLQCAGARYRHPSGRPVGRQRQRERQRRGAASAAAGVGPSAAGRAGGGRPAAAVARGPDGHGWRRRAGAGPWWPAASASARQHDPRGADAARAGGRDEPLGDRREASCSWPHATASRAWTWLARPSRPSALPKTCRWRASNGCGRTAAAWSACRPMPTARATWFGSN